MKHIVLMISVIAAGAIRCFAQQAKSDTQTYNFTITDCINYAYAHQDTVLNANLDVKSAEYKIKETTGIGLPQISGSVSFQDYLKTPSILFPSFTDGLYQILHSEGVKNGKGDTVALKTSKPSNFSIYQKYNNPIGVTLNQIIFDGSYLVGLKAARTYKELYERSYTRSRIDAAVNVTKAYYQVLVSNEQLKLIDADLNQLKQQFDQTSAQNKQGFVEQIDVQRLEVQYNNLLTTKENTVRMLVLNYELLKFQMGMPINTNLVLKEKLADIDLKTDLVENNDTTFYHNRIEYNLYETTLELNKLDLQRKKTQFFPTLSFVANAGDQFQNNSFSQLYSTNYISSYVGLNLNIPIYAGGQHKNQVRQSQITVEKSQNDLYNIKNAISLQASSARITYVNGLKSLENQSRNEHLAQEVLRVSKIKYQQGVGSSIEVTQAQTDLESADNQYIQALYNALTSKVDLDKAYGRIK